jgi:hypothetical protein
LAEANEARGIDRFTAVEPVSGFFGSTAITFLDISDSGARVEHSVPLKLATTGRFRFRQNEISGHAQGVVIWSRLSETRDSKGKTLYHSGIRFDGTGEVAQGISAMVERGVLVPDAESLRKKEQRMLEKEQARRVAPRVRPIQHVKTIPQDVILLVQHARNYLGGHPDEALKWYQRARFATEGQDISYREDVLAVWEYLERSVDLATITQVFEHKV